MAIQFQMTSSPGYTDYAFKNYGATDIPAFVAVSVDATNAVNLATNDSIGVVVVVNAGDPVVGVTQEIVKAGAMGRVRCPGPISVMLADATVTAGTYVEASATALKVGFAKTQAAGKGTVGLALSTAATDGDPVAVLLAIAPNA